MVFSIRPVTFLDIWNLKPLWSQHSILIPRISLEVLLQEQSQGKRWLWAAFQETFVGFISVKRQVKNGPFALKKIPVIFDLFVLPHARGQGVGSALLSCAEENLQNQFSGIGVGVGLSREFGPAQRLYARNGYFPEGSGVTFHGEYLSKGDSCVLDDDCVLWLEKHWDNVSSRA